MHYDLAPDSPTRLRGFCLIDNTPAGQFTQAHAARKWTSLLPPEIPPFLFKKTNFQELFHETLLSTLPKVLPNYLGPVGIDAMIYRENDQLHLEPIVEVNARHTMGRLTLNLQHLLNCPQASLMILPKGGKPTPNGYLPFNDPEQAQMLQAYIKINVLGSEIEWLVTASTTLYLMISSMNMAKLSVSYIYKDYAINGNKTI